MPTSRRSALAAIASGDPEPAEYESAGSAKTGTADQTAVRSGIELREGSIVAAGVVAVLTMPITAICLVIDVVR